MSDKTTVTSQLLYTNNSQTVPAIASEKIFISNTKDYEFRGTNEIIFRVASSESNLFLDAKHSFVRLDIENPNAFDVFFDGSIGAVIIDRFAISCGGIIIEDQRHYGKRINTFLTHYGSNEFMAECALVGAAPSKMNADGTYKLDATVVENDNHRIIKNNKKVSIAIPVISDFLQSKLLPLAFMGTSYLELHFWLQDPRIALLVDGSATSATVSGTTTITRTLKESDVKDINYIIKKAEYVSNCIAIKDNSLMASLQNQLETKSLFITGKSWTAYENVEPASNQTDLTYTINDKSASMCYIMNAQYLLQASPFVSNNHSAVFSQKSYSLTIGSENFPRSKPVEYNDDSTNKSFMNPYLQCQRVSCSGGGFFNTGNHTSVNLKNFTAQSPSSCFEFGTESSKLKLPDTALSVSVVPSCFVNAYSFCSFDNISGSSDVGINTRALNLPLSINIKRDLSTFTGGKNFDGTAYTTGKIPSLLNITYVCSDVVWSLGSDRQWKVDR